MCVKGFAVDGFRPNATEVGDDDTFRSRPVPSFFLDLLLSCSLT